LLVFLFTGHCSKASISDFTYPCGLVQKRKNSYRSAHEKHGFEKHYIAKSVCAIMNFFSGITTLALLPWKKVQIFAVLTAACAKTYLNMQ